MGDFFKDRYLWKWNVFDFVLVFIMDAELALKYMFNIDFSSLKSLRILRLLRMSKLVRALKMVPELGLMVKSIVASIKGASAAMVLAFSIMFIFAVLFTQ